MLFTLHAGGGTEVSVCFVTFRRASVHVRELRASGEEDAFGLGLHWGLHFLCFAGPHLSRTSVRFVPVTWSRIPAHGAVPFPPPGRGPNSPGQPASRPALPVRTSATPIAFPPFLSGWRATGPHPPALAKPAADARALNSHGPRGFASRKHKK